MRLEKLLSASSFLPKLDLNKKRPPTRNKPPAPKKAIDAWLLVNPTEQAKTKEEIKQSTPAHWCHFLLVTTLSPVEPVFPDTRSSTGFRFNNFLVDQTIANKEISVAHAPPIIIELRDAS